MLVPAGLSIRASFAQTHLMTDSRMCMAKAILVWASFAHSLFLQIQPNMAMPPSEFFIPIPHRWKFFPVFYTDVIEIQGA